MTKLYPFRCHFNTKKKGGKGSTAYYLPKINQDRDGWAMAVLTRVLANPCLLPENKN